MSDFTVHKIAVGWNNAALLKPFWALNPPLFTDYRRAIRQQDWRSYQGAQLTGGHTDKSWGLAQVTLVFGKLSRAEFAYLVTLQGKVTLYTLNEDTNTWGNYNGVLRKLTAGEFNKSGNRYESVLARYIDLDAL